MSQSITKENHRTNEISGESERAKDREGATTVEIDKERKREEGRVGEGERERKRERERELWRNSYCISVLVCYCIYYHVFD